MHPCRGVGVEILANLTQTRRWGIAPRSLGCHLAASGTRVFLFDLRPPAQPLPKGVSFVQGDITSYESVEQALSLPGGVSCVYHVASYGMSGAEAVQHALIEQVNVTGTYRHMRARRVHAQTPYLWMRDTRITL